MRLTAVQLPARFDAFDEQVRAAELMLEGGPRSDLVLFHEAAFTGYVSPRGVFDLTRFAEPTAGRAREALAHLARRFDALVVGPVIENAEGRLFNSLLAVTPEGQTLFHYRKRHPWFPEAWATAGDTPFPLVEWRGVTLTAGVCFDVHFLADVAPAELTAADVLLFPSAWVDEPEAPDARPGHLSALAQRFDVAVLNANWGEGKPRVPGQGGSLFMRRGGAIAARLEAGLARLDIDFEARV